jgi:TorA maturation chaperone TorD
MFAEEDLFGSIISAAALIDAELAQQAQALKATFEATPLQDLLVDYTRLFLGAPQALAKPYASVWLSSEPQLMQDSVQELLKLYGQGGFEVAADFMDLPDHVAVELEFLYLLTWQHNRALEAGDAAAAQAVEVLRTAFLIGHLGRWLGGFVLAVHEHAQCSFYEALAELTERFVRLEGQWQQAPAAAVQH